MRVPPLLLVFAPSSHDLSLIPVDVDKSGKVETRRKPARASLSTGPVATSGAFIVFMVVVVVMVMCVFAVILATLACVRTRAWRLHLVIIAPTHQIVLGLAAPVMRHLHVLGRLGCLQAREVHGGGHASTANHSPAA